MIINKKTSYNGEAIEQEDSDMAWCGIKPQITTKVKNLKFDVIDCDPIEEPKIEDYGPITESEVRYSGVDNSGSTTFILNESGDLLGSGLNNFGILNQGDVSNRKEFVLIEKNVSRFWTTTNSLIYQLKDGTYWTVGGSNYLPGVTNTNYKNSVPIPGLNDINKDIYQLHFNDYGCIVIKNDGSIWKTTSSADGITMRKDNVRSANSLIKVDFVMDFSNEDIFKLPENVQEISIDTTSPGNIYKLYFIQDNKLYGLGQYQYNSWGDPENNTNTSTPIFIDDNIKLNTLQTANHTILYEKKDGSIWGFGRNYLGTLGLNTIAEIKVPTRIEWLEDPNIKFYRLEYTNLLVQKNDNKFYMCGNIYSAYYGSTSMITLNDNSLSTIDGNNLIELNYGSTLESTKTLPVVDKVKSNDTYLVYIKDGKLYGRGYNTYQVISKDFANNTNVTIDTLISDNLEETEEVIDVLIGYNFMFYKTSFEETIKWYFKGYNEGGVAGIGTNINYLDPVEVPYLSESNIIQDSIFINYDTIQFETTDNNIMFCGANTNNHNKNLYTNINTPINIDYTIELPTNAKKIFGDDYNTYVLTYDDDVYVSGSKGAYLGLGGSTSTIFVKSDELSQIGVEAIYPFKGDTLLVKTNVEVNKWKYIGQLDYVNYKTFLKSLGINFYLSGSANNNEDAYPKVSILSNMSTYFDDVSDLKITNSNKIGIGALYIKKLILTIFQFQILIIIFYHKK